MGVVCLTSPQEGFPPAGGQSEEADSTPLQNITSKSASELDDESEGIIWFAYFRTFIENGEKVKKPANQWHIFLEHGPPENCHHRAYHLELLKLIVGSAAEEVYEGFITETVFAAILTDEELGKLTALKEVKRYEKENDGICLW